MTTEVERVVKNIRSKATKVRCLWHKYAEFTMEKDKVLMEGRTQGLEEAAIYVETGKWPRGREGESVKETHRRCRSGQKEQAE